MDGLSTQALRNCRTALRIGEGPLMTASEACDFSRLCQWA